MKIYGYSERGMINSLMFNISEDKDLMIKFMEILPEKISQENEIPTDFDVIIEPSFSAFGGSDLIVIAYYENRKYKKVIFFEANVKPYGKIYNIEDELSSDRYVRFESNRLFAQLSAKQLLIEYIDYIKKGQPIKVDGDRSRRIGENEVVKRALKMIDGAKDYFYIGIVPNDIFTDETKRPKEFKLLLWKEIEKFCVDNNLKKVLDMFEFNKGQIY